MVTACARTLKGQWQRKFHPLCSYHQLLWGDLDLDRKKGHINIKAELLSFRDVQNARNQCAVDFDVVEENMSSSHIMTFLNK